MYLSVDDGIKNVDIKFNAKTRFWNDIHQARSGITFIRHVLEYPSSGTFWNTLHQARSGIPFIRDVQCQICGSKKTKGHNQDTQNRLWSHMSQGKDLDKLFMNKYI
jgi:hypothetical protein